MKVRKITKGLWLKYSAWILALGLASWAVLTGWEDVARNRLEQSWEAKVTKSHRVREMTQNEFQSYLKKAENGDAEAAIVVSQWYLFRPRYTEDGESKASDKNHMMMLTWSRIAAVLGRADAQNDLHTFLSNSSNLEDRMEARRWLEKSAEQGFPVAVERLERIKTREAAARE
jgi:TPR repeat protein